MPYSSGPIQQKGISPADVLRLDIEAMQKEIDRFSGLRDRADELGRVALQKEIDEWTKRLEEKQKLLEAQSDSQ